MECRNRSISCKVSEVTFLLFITLVKLRIPVYHLDHNASGTVWSRWAESTTKAKRIVAKQVRAVDRTSVKPKEKAKKDT